MAASTGMVVVGPWAFAVVALVVLLLGFVVVMVRSARTNMSVRIGRIEIQRGESDPPTSASPQLRSVDKPAPDDQPSKQSGQGQSPRTNWSANPTSMLGQ